MFYIRLVCLLIGALFIVSQTQFRSDFQKVSGVVVGFANLYGLQKSQTNFNTVVSFYDLGGQISYAVSTTGSSSPLNQIGEELPVYITKQSPPSAVIPSKSILIAGWISAGLGVGCISFFIANFRWDAYSIGSSLLTTFAIIAASWKTRKPAATLDKPKWKELKSKMLVSKIYSENEKDQIPWVPSEEVEVSVEKTKKAYRTSIPACAVIGIGCALGSFASYHQTQKFLKTSLSTKGTVVDMATQSGKTTTYAPIIEFKRPGTLQTYRFRHSVSSSHPSYRIGDRVNVLYDPVHPENARINAGKWNQAPSLFLAALSALFLFLTWHSIRSFEKFNHLKRRTPVIPRQHSSRSA